MRPLQGDVAEVGHGNGHRPLDDLWGAEVDAVLSGPVHPRGPLSAVVAAGNYVSVDVRAVGELVNAQVALMPAREASKP